MAYNLHLDDQGQFNQIMQNVREACLKSPLLSRTLNVILSLLLLSASLKSAGEMDIASAFPLLIQKSHVHIPMAMQASLEAEQMLLNFIGFSTNMLLSSALFKLKEKDGEIEAEADNLEDLEDFRQIYENGVTRGGGQGVLLASGEFELLDLVDLSRQTPVLALNDLEGDPQTCGSGVVTGLTFNKEEHAEFLRKLDELAQIVPAYGALLKLAGGSVSLKSVLVDFNDQKLFSHWKDSTKIPTAYQHPIAFFNGGALIIVKPLYEKLSPRGRVALFVHETLRQVANGLLGNDAGNGSLVLDTVEEIVYELFIGGNRQRIAQLMGKSTLELVGSKLKEIALWFPVDLLPSEAKERVRARFVDKLKDLSESVKNQEDLKMAIMIHQLSGFNNVNYKTLLFEKLQKLSKTHDPILQNEAIIPLLIGVYTAMNRQLSSLSPLVSGTTFNVTMEKQSLCRTLESMMTIDPKN